MSGLMVSFLSHDNYMRSSSVQYIWQEPTDIGFIGDDQIEMLQRHNFMVYMEESPADKGQQNAIYKVGPYFIVLLERQPTIRGWMIRCWKERDLW